MLKLLGTSAGAALVGTGLAAGSESPLHLQVTEPGALCNTVPGDHHLAFIEDASHERGRGFYAGTDTQTWAFTGWLTQTKPSTTAGGSVKPADDATEPANRLIQVYHPDNLKQYEATDQHFAFVEDPSHPRGRGFYTGAASGKWYFVGWLAQSQPAESAGGSVTTGSGASRPDERLLQVNKPKDLAAHDPSDHHLAFIENPKHEHGRGFYAGGSNGTWYFVGWLAQSRPSGTVEHVIDPSSDECGTSSGTGTGDGSDDGSDDSTGDTGTGEDIWSDGVSNGAWRWWGEDIAAYESWQGESLPVVATGHGKNKWESFIDFDTRDFSEYVSADTGRVLLPHIPMLPREENDAIGRAQALRNLAAGKYNDKFRSMAERFKGDGFTPDTLVLRIGNEFNIKAQPYSPIGTGVSASTWVEGYRQIVDVCRDVLGEDLETVWAPLIHSTQMSPQQVLDHYPGADYAMVGADLYDSAPAYNKPSRAPDGIDYDTASDSERATVQQYVWEETHCKGNKWGADGVGLNDIARLADDVGRRIAIPEWGLSFDDYEWAGGENPVFVQNMYDWMNDNDVAFHAYFEHDTPQVAHELCDGDFDFATAETTYQGTFGGKDVDTDDGSGSEEDDSDPIDTSSENFIFLTKSELDTQKQRATSGKQPWASAYRNLLSDADSALNSSLESVTNHYFTGDDYGKDYPSAIKMSEMARDCALAYRFSGKEKYAKRAVEVIHHWCLKDSSYMTPTVDIKQKSGSIEQHITIPAFVYAASLLQGHPAWDAYDGSRPWDGGRSANAEAAFQQWVADRADTYVSSRPSYCVKNNKWAWRIADRSVTAAYLGDDAMMETNKQMWKGQAEQCSGGAPRPWIDYVNNYKNSRAYDGTSDPNNNALFKLELNRAEGFEYTEYNLKAMLMSLLVFERYDGTSLYEYNAPTDNKGGSSMWKALNWFDDYVQDTSAWQWDSGRVSKSAVKKAAATFEVAHAHWGEFDGPIDNPDKIGGRPHYDMRLLGHVTLTHGAK